MAPTSATSGWSSSIRRPASAAIRNRAPREHRHQLRSLDPHLSRRLVLPARHARFLLPGRELHLQHPHGPLAQGHRPLSRQHGRRHARRRRQVVCRIARSSRRARALRAARSRPGRAEILAALRGRSRSRRRQRARHPAAALARRLAGGRRQSSWRALTPSNPRAPAPCSSSRCRDFPVGGFRPRRPPGGSGPPPSRSPARPLPTRNPRKWRRTGRRLSDVRLAPAMLQAQQKWVIAPRRQCRRISRRAVFQDHDCRHGALADRDRRR